MKFQNQNWLNISYFLISLLPCFNCLQVIKFEYKSPDFESVSHFHHLLMLGLNTAGYRDSIQSSTSDNTNLGKQMYLTILVKFKGGDFFFNFVTNHLNQSFRYVVFLNLTTEWMKTCKQTC